MYDNYNNRSMPVSNYQDLINEAKAKKNKKPIMMPEVLTIEDDMEQTKELVNFSDEILDKLDEMIAKKPKKKVQSDMSLEASFIYCSILGFITFFMGYGVFLYIVSQL